MINLQYNLYYIVIFFDEFRDFIVNLRFVMSKLVQNLRPCYTPPKSWGLNTYTGKS